MSTKTINKENLSTDIENLISIVTLEGEGSNIFELRCDAVPLAFREFLSSEWYAALSQDRKKTLFDKYLSLNHLLLELDEFATKYRDLDRLKVIASFKDN